MQQWENLTDKQFSGFCDQPMWLAAAAAVSTIYCAYLVFVQTEKTRLQQYLYIVLLLCSIYVTMISGSRSAFLAAITIPLVLRSRRFASAGLKLFSVSGSYSPFS